MKTDSQFIAALSESQAHVAGVAAWLQGVGCDVLIRPTLIRPDFESRNEYIDGGDIEIRQRIEVKHRSIEFTSREDYPYPTVIVDEQFKIDRIPRARLWGYVILNESGTHACCIRSATKEQWSTVRRFDRKDGQERAFYVCPKDACSFCKILQ